MENTGLTVIWPLMTLTGNFMKNVMEKKIFHFQPFFTVSRIAPLSNIAYISSTSWDARKIPTGIFFWTFFTLECTETSCGNHCFLIGPMLFWKAQSKLRKLPLSFDAQNEYLLHAVDSGFFCDIVDQGVLYTVANIMSSFHCRRLCQASFRGAFFRGWPFQFLILCYSHIQGILLVISACFWAVFACAGRKCRYVRCIWMITRYRHVISKQASVDLSFLGDGGDKTGILRGRRRRRWS